MTWEIGTRYSSRRNQTWTRSFTSFDGTRPDWGRHFDATINRLLGAGAPQDPMEKFWLEAGYFQLHLDPESVVRARQIADLVGITFRRP